MANDDSGLSRRRTLALGVTGLIAFLTAGLGWRGPDDDGVVLTVDRGPDPRDPDERPPEDGSPGRPTGGPADTADGETGGNGRRAGGDRDRSDPDRGDRPHDGADRSRRPPEAPDSPAVSTRTGSDLTVASTAPLEFSDALLGDDGLVPVTLALSGGSARVAVRCEITDDAERGRTDPEIEAVDEGPPGELAEHLQVELRRVTDSRLVYEGTLDDFGARAGRIPLPGTCLEPGVHRLHLRWHLPADTPDVVQTDTVRFSLRFAAAACAAGAP